MNCVKKKPKFASKLEKCIVVLENYLTAWPLSFSDYLCKPEDNIYSIDFTRFKIRDLETGTVLFEIAKPCVSGRPRCCHGHRIVGVGVVVAFASCVLDSSVSHFHDLPKPGCRLLCRVKLSGEPGLVLVAAFCSAYTSSCSPHTSGRSYCSHLTNKETEAQNFQVTFLKSYALSSYHVASP